MRSCPLSAVLPDAMGERGGGRQASVLLWRSERPQWTPKCVSARRDEDGQQRLGRRPHGAMREADVHRTLSAVDARTHVRDRAVGGDHEALQAAGAVQPGPVGRSAAECVAAAPAEQPLRRAAEGALRRAVRRSDPEPAVDEDDRVLVLHEVRDAPRVPVPGPIRPDGEPVTAAVEGLDVARAGPAIVQAAAEPGDVEIDGARGPGAGSRGQHLALDRPALRLEKRPEDTELRRRQGDLRAVAPEAAGPGVELEAAVPIDAVSHGGGHLGSVRSRDDTA